MPSRLGDVIDDHCGRCGRLTDHSIVAMMNGEPVRVRCRTCNHEHAYRHGKGGRKQVSKQSAFDQVLSGILAEQRGEPATGESEEQTKRPVRRKRASDG